MSPYEPMSPDTVRELMMKRVDGEISDADRARLERHLDAHPELRAELAELQRVRIETMNLKSHLMPDVAWDAYWHGLYNRLERGFAWLLIALGGLVAGGYGLYHIALALWRDPVMPPLLKVGLMALVAGSVILMLSVVRERFLLRKHDKYRGIQR